MAGGTGRWVRCLAAAMQWGLTTYDAVYVLLALDLDAELVTADTRLLDAGLRLGQDETEPGQGALAALHLEASSQAAQLVEPVGDVELRAGVAEPVEVGQPGADAHNVAPLAIGNDGGQPAQVGRDPLDRVVAGGPHRPPGRQPDHRWPASAESLAATSAAQ